MLFPYRESLCVLPFMCLCTSYRLRHSFHHSSRHYLRYYFTWLLPSQAPRHHPAYILGYKYCIVSFGFPSPCCIPGAAIASATAAAIASPASGARRRRLGSPVHAVHLSRLSLSVRCPHRLPPDIGPPYNGASYRHLRVYCS